MRESNIERELVKQVKQHGGKCKKWVCPGSTGEPDRIVFFPNAVFFVETKSPTGRLRPRQKKVHEELADFGFDVVVLSSKEAVKFWVEAQSSVLQKLASKNSLQKKCYCPIENHNDLSPTGKCYVCGGAQ